MEFLRWIRRYSQSYFEPSLKKTVKFQTLALLRLQGWEMDQVFFRIPIEVDR